MSFPGGSAVKNQSGNVGDAVQSLGWEHPLEEDVQPTPVFLPGEPHGQRSLVGYNPLGHKESDMTVATEHTHTNSHEVSFWGDWNVLELDIVMFTQYCEYAKNH